MKKIFLLVLLLMFFAVSAFGATADTSANAKTQALLTYITGLSSKVLSGQEDGNADFGDGATGRNAAVAAKSPYKYPAIMGLIYSTFPAAFTTQNNKAIAHSAAGGIVLAQPFWDNPLTGTWGGDLNTTEMTQVVTVGHAYNTAWNTILNSMATSLATLQTNNVSVILNAFTEPDNSGDRWYYMTNANAIYFKNLWIYTFDYLTRDVANCTGSQAPYKCCTGAGAGNCKGLHNLLWLYSTDNTYLYPGTAYVDLVGYSYYDSDNNGTISATGISRANAAIAAFSKPFGFSEMGVCDWDETAVTCTPRAHMPMLTSIKTSIPATKFWLTWNSWWSMDHATDLPTLFGDSWVITRDEVNYYGTASAALKLDKAGTGTGTVTSNPAGISCDATCTTQSYNFQTSPTPTQVTLEAAATSGHTFTGWSGGGCSGTGNCTVTMSGAVTVVATFTLTVGTACSGASPTWTAQTANADDVQDCVNKATYGDTINIPACASGLCVYDSSHYVSTSKDLRFVGAGIDTTYITVGFTDTGLPYEGAFKFTPDAEARGRLQTVGPTLPIFEITGITFKGSKYDYKSALYADSSGTPIVRNLRIHGCKFDSVRSALRVNKYIYGVADSNYWTNSNFAYNLGNEKAHWNSYPMTLGSSDGFYFEDNIIDYPTYYENLLMGGGHGGGWVVRYNTITGTGYGFYESHGNQSGGITSTQKTEYYGNDWSGFTTDTKEIDYRGGKNLMFYNKLNANISANDFELREENRDAYTGTYPYLTGACVEKTVNDGTGVAQRCYDSVDAATGTPCVCMKINHSYFFNNRVPAGTSLNPQVEQDTWQYNGAPNNPAELVENREYFLYNTDFGERTDGKSTGVGCGTLVARPVTCNYGVGYWATNQSCANVTGLVGASTVVTGGTRDPASVITGALYRCTSTDTWTLYYTPYTYPHPIRNAGTPPVDDTAPTQPTSLTATALSYPAINLNWTASTDAVGVTGYKILRCLGDSCTPTAQVAISTSTTYQDLNLTSSSVYGYRIVAYDAAGNNSLASTAVYATTPSADVNIALNKTVTASTEYQNYPGCGGTHCLAAYATDGLLTTRWASFYADPQWIKVDLGADYDVNRVVIRFYSSFSKDYTVEYSTDDITYTVAATVVGGDGGVDTHTISPAVTARYIKLNSTARYNAYSNSIWEFEVYGTASSNYLEFENAAVCTLVPPMVSVPDALANGGYYIHSTLANSGTATCTFTVATSGYYKIMARVYAPNTASDSLKVQVDALGEDIYDLNAGGDPSKLGVWFEDEVSLRGTGTVYDQYDPYVFYAAAGAHTVVFTGREVSGANSPRLDYFYIVPVSIPEQYALTYTKAGTGSGVVVFNGINCSDSCAYSFNAGTPITITGTAGGDSTFAGWSGGLCTGTAPCTFNMTEARAVTGTFTLNPSLYTLTITKAGTGLGTVTSSPTGMSCGSTCAFDFIADSVVTLTATPTPGHTFTGWSGTGGCTGTGTHAITMSAAKACTATFTRTGVPVSGTNFTLTYGKMAGGGAGFTLVK